MRFMPLKETTMTNLKRILLAAALSPLALSATAFGPQAYAAPDKSDLAPLAKERFQIRGRVLGVVPDESSSVNIGGDVDVSDSLTAELDFSYFFTDHIAAELIAGTARHELDYGSSNLGDVWILPPTVTVQYHFTPDQKFSPYVGAGLNYSIFYGESAGTGFSDLNVDNGVGYALQAGADYWLTPNWGLNFDVKKLWLNVDASLNNGAVTADVDLDPWLIGAGVSYRF